MTTQPDRLTVLRLAAEAGADPRSAKKALMGQPVKGLAGERLARALARLTGGKHTDGAGSSTPGTIP